MRRTETRSFPLEFRAHFHSNIFGSILSRSKSLLFRLHLGHPVAVFEVNSKFKVFFFSVDRNGKNARNVKFRSPAHLFITAKCVFIQKHKDLIFVGASIIFAFLAEYWITIHQSTKKALAARYKFYSRVSAPSIHFVAIYSLDTYIFRHLIQAETLEWFLNSQ